MGETDSSFTLCFLPCRFHELAASDAIVALQYLQVSRISSSAHYCLIKWRMISQNLTLPGMFPGTNCDWL